MYVRGKLKGRNADLEFNALFFGVGALGEIGDHTEATARVFDDGDGGSPSAKGVLRRVFGLNVKVLSEILLHCSLHTH